MTNNVEFKWELQGTCPRPDGFGQGPGDPLGSERQRVRTARRILAAGRAREEDFSCGTFGDPAWEMLLILYMRECAGAFSTLAGLLSAQEIPGSSAERWLDHLAQQGAIWRGFRTELGEEVVELSASGRGCVERYLNALGAA